jgi:Holliday junction DNA helicase RuvB
VEKKLVFRAGRRTLEKPGFKPLSPSLARACIINEMTKQEPEKQAETVDQELRPKDWDGYIGQDLTKTNLRLMIEAAKKRGESLDHVLLYGQAGLGKTTLAYIIGREMGVNVKTTTGPALEKAGDVAAILSNIEPNEILFIDEIHRINKFVEEMLYPALESRKLHLVVGKGSSARTFSLDLPPFTVVGATTKVSLLSNPLRSRFGGMFKLEYYSADDVKKILRQSAEILKASIDEDAIRILAEAARFTPRVANRLLKRARDYAEVYAEGNIGKEAAEKTLALLDIDPRGLERADRELLSTIIKKFNGGPVGVKSLAASLSEEIGTIEDVYEPFLLALHMIERTPLGRIATEEAYEHIGAAKKTRLV